MKELVEYIIASLVDQPEQVSVRETDYDGEMLLELSVAEGDMGRVIGKGGRVINAVRTVVQVSAARQGKRVSLEILEHD